MYKFIFYLCFGITVLACDTTNNNNLDNMTDDININDITDIDNSCNTARSNQKLNTVISPPCNLSGKKIKHTVESGTGIFATSGEFTLSTSSEHSIYDISGDSLNIFDSSGTYTYTTNGNETTITLTDSIFSHLECVYNYTSADFTGFWSFLRPDGSPAKLSSNLPASGFLEFDFTTGLVDKGEIYGEQPFSGVPWTIQNIVITPDENGDFHGSFEWHWGLIRHVNIDWQITDHGNGTATILTLDKDGDGVPGIPLEFEDKNQPFLGFNISLDGLLTLTSGTYRCTATSDPESIQSGTFNEI